ncbi:MAG: hypothetical protein WAQ53_07950 [Thiofilum sp.]|uniref:hypothetical protein n=1 Tax=Thiofilum sp. TaxID=2212733 RepID=UPI0025E006C5|nr:hypothetical protein [Thiofilum sp.]MBK8454114.1 hypothetical protein [Thiofilum sp.]
MNSLTPTPLLPVGFAQRLPHVKAEIERRIATHKPENTYFLRSRLWNAWLEKNVWSGVRHA